MSIRVMTLVWERSRHAGTDLLMLLALADFSDDQGNSYPGVPALAAKCRMSVRNAGYILKSLQVAGELEVRQNEGPKGTNRYRIVLEALRPLQPAAGERGAQGVQSTAGVGVQSAAPLQAAAPLQSSVGTPAIQRRLPLQPTADEPSGTVRNRESARARRTAMPDAFDLAVSPRVKAWATRKGFGDLEAHLEHFVGKARANGYAYCNWDDALMNAIRDDWAKLRATNGVRRPVLDADEVFEETH